MRRSSTILAALAGVGSAVIATGLIVAGGTASSAPDPPPLDVVEQNQPAFDPFQVELFPKNQFCGIAEVPAGKRLVIEYVSANIEEGGATFALHTTAGGVPARHLIMLHHPPESNAVAGQAVRVYADPGTEVEACVGHGLGVVILSGHLVQLPS